LAGAGTCIASISVVMSSGVETSLAVVPINDERFLDFARNDKIEMKNV
jgi:hypothetical protein